MENGKRVFCAVKYLRSAWPNYGAQKNTMNLRRPAYVSTFMQQYTSLIPDTQKIELTQFLYSFKHIKANLISCRDNEINDENLLSSIQKINKNVSKNCC